jgi:indolepyruvate decarboxylase
LAALCTTQGVGELSGINGIAGAYSEYLPIFHLVGMQPSTTWKSHVYMHHTRGTEEHDVFFKMSKYVYCAQAILTPENCISEMDRLIDAALYNWRPVYIGIPEDYASSIIQENVSITKNNTMSINSDSSSSAVRAVVKAIVEVVQKAKTVCILPGVLISRLGLYDAALALLD